jgi:ubiquinone/menaquinone biosynthesis C-methylase UbiE
MTLRSRSNKPFHDHFSSIAECYAHFRPRYHPALFDFLATLVPRNAPVWDCACGSGQASLDLATRFNRVVATDASREQIASATAHPNVEYRVAPAEQSGLPGKSVSLITVAAALHWFDLERFYAEVRRVVRPHGVLAAWACPFLEVEGDTANQLVQEFRRETVGPYWPPERKLAEAGYRTISFPFVEITPPKFCMEARWTLAQFLGYLGTWSATKRFMEATGSNPLEKLSVELSEVWSDGSSTRLVTWPLALRVGRWLE